ncbi:hypothetical protein BDZ85DRAFT_175284, partial [Elsinoe ampelina]
QSAAEGGRTESARLLIGAGADIDDVGSRYGTALQAAADSGELRALKYLLDAGADPNVEGSEYGNALQAAICG